MGRTPRNELSPEAREKERQYDRARRPSRPRCHQRTQPRLVAVAGWLVFYESRTIEVIELVSFERLFNLAAPGRVAAVRRATAAVCQEATRRGLKVGSNEVDVFRDGKLVGRVMISITAPSTVAEADRHRLPAQPADPIHIKIRGRRVRSAQK